MVLSFPPCPPPPSPPKDIKQGKAYSLRRKPGCPWINYNSAYPWPHWSILSFFSLMIRFQKPLKNSWVCYTPPDYWFLWPTADLQNLRQRSISAPHYQRILLTVASRIWTENIVHVKQKKLCLGALAFHTVVWGKTSLGISHHFQHPYKSFVFKMEQPHIVGVIIYLRHNMHLPLWFICGQSSAAKITSLLRLYILKSRLLFSGERCLWSLHEVTVPPYIYKEIQTE